MTRAERIAKVAEHLANVDRESDLVNFVDDEIDWSEIARHAIECMDVLDTVDEANAMD